MSLKVLGESKALDVKWNLVHNAMCNMKGQPNKQ